MNNKLIAEFSLKKSPKTLFTVRSSTAVKPVIVVYSPVTETPIE